jgi:hypothetical protein
MRTSVPDDCFLGFQYNSFIWSTICGEVPVAGFDLQSFLDRFADVCEKEFGRRYNFRALEKDFSYLQRPEQWLSAKHILSLFDERKTPFARYWQKPNEEELDGILKKRRLCLALPSDSSPSRHRELLQTLLGALHNLGTASLVLRFTHPARFGTFSTPIVHLLQIQEETTLDLYLAYCKELGEWQKHFKLPSVAETEMGLWAFHKLASGSSKIPAEQEARASFDRDIWVQRQRARQALRPFLGKYGPLELARILVGENPKWAGMIAGEEYERLLRFAARKLAGDLKLYVKGSTEILFDKLVEDGHISLEDKALLRKAWKTRNAAVHPGEALSEEEVENMIEIVERICRPWEQ